MKLRKGFVSNSSSSSFTCDISGETESGWDLCLKNAEMCGCENDHVMQEEYVLEHIQHRIEVDGVSACKEMLKSQPGALDYFQSSYDDHIEDNEQEPTTDVLCDIVWEAIEDYMERSEIPASCCPLCSLSRMSDYNVLQYLLKRMKRSMHDVCREIQNEYGGSPEAFYNYLNEEH
jgi:hypothetical protein